MSTTTQTEHPHVRRDEKGRPVVGNTKLEVHVLAGYWRLGWQLEDLACGYPYLSMAEILDALSYYMDHTAEVDALIRANEPPAETELNG